MNSSFSPEELLSLLSSPYSFPLFDTLVLLSVLRLNYTRLRRGSNYTYLEKTFLMYSIVLQLWSFFIISYSSIDIISWFDKLFALLNSTNVSVDAVDAPFYIFFFDVDDFFSSSCNSTLL